jgi:hypothetical protein
MTADTKTGRPGPDSWSLVSPSTRSRSRWCCTRRRARQGPGEPDSAVGAPDGAGRRAYRARGPWPDSGLPDAKRPERLRRRSALERAVGPGPGGGTACGARGVAGGSFAGRICRPRRGRKRPGPGCRGTRAVASRDRADSPVGEDADADRVWQHDELPGFAAIWPLGPARMARRSASSRSIGASTPCCAGCRHSSSSRRVTPTPCLIRNTISSASRATDPGSKPGRAGPRCAGRLLYLSPAPRAAGTAASHVDKFGGDRTTSNWVSTARVGNAKPRRALIRFQEAT